VKNKSRIPIRLVAWFLIMIFFSTTRAEAGPPLVCHSFDIGDAKSLPWISHSWNLTGGESYQTKNLATDTIVILDSSSFVLVHMETLRRATLYARTDPVAAKQLLTKLVARENSAGNTPQAALALFDAGYLAETYKQWLGKGEANPAQGLDGFALVKKALQLRGNDAQMDFAAALISLSGPAAENQAYAQKAIAGAKSDPLLARNLSSHFIGPQSETMVELISHAAFAKEQKP
jgi:hypothetical protein